VTNGYVLARKTRLHRGWEGPGGKSKEKKHHSTYKRPEKRNVPVEGSSTKSLAHGVWGKKHVKYSQIRQPWELPKD